MYFFKIYFNNILSFLSVYSKWYLPFSFSYKMSAILSKLFKRATEPARSIHHFVTVILRRIIQITRQVIKINYETPKQDPDKP